MTLLDGVILGLGVLLAVVVWLDANDRRPPPRAGKWRRYGNHR